MGESVADRNGEYRRREPRWPFLAAVLVGAVLGSQRFFFSGDLVWSAIAVALNIAYWIALALIVAGARWIEPWRIVVFAAACFVAEHLAFWIQSMYDLGVFFIAYRIGLWIVQVSLAALVGALGRPMRWGLCALFAVLTLLLPALYPLPYSEWIVHPAIRALDALFIACLFAPAERSDYSSS